MNCNIIRDLLPLCADNCCSKESEQLVAEHLKTCAACRAALEGMKAALPVQTAISSPPKKTKRINDWKASVLQSVLLFASFVMLAVGVALEAATPEGAYNGVWALALIIPATGLLLSMANWYFVRLYPSKKAFSVGSCLATLGICAAAEVWAAIHYEINLPAAGEERTVALAIGLALTAVVCVLSAVLSKTYAQLLGKE